jgi:hypothetical protein
MNKLIVVFLTLVVLVACKKESEELQLPTISDYAPLQAGKYITYSLDSFIFVASGTQVAHRYYDVKYSTTDSITDNLGRKAFRIVRSIKTLPNGNFVPDNTFFAVNAGNGLEFTENNLRFLKLVQPIKEGGNWKGNSAIDASSAGSNFQYLFDWDYTYANVGSASPVTIPNTTLSNTITVNQHDVSFNLPVVLPGGGGVPTNIASKDSAVEIYAKGIGMVYKKFLHWEYQISSNGTSGSYNGFGVTLVMKDHN